MNGTKILATASSILETYGDNAKFHIAEQMDQAMQAGDGASYDEWAMVAKAVVLMGMPRAEAAKAEPDVADAIRRSFKAA
jgi:hypothetical protein